MLSRALIVTLLVGTGATASAHAQTATAATTGTAATPDAATATATVTATNTVATEAPVSLDHARKLVEFFWAGQVDSLWAEMSPELQGKVRSPEAISEKLLEVAGRYGSETKVIEETIVPADGRFVYERTIQLESSPGPLVFLWTFDADGQLSDVNMRPKKAQ